MPSRLQLTQDRPNGLENMINPPLSYIGGNGRPQPVWEYGVSRLQRDIRYVQLRREAFRFDCLLLSTLINLSGEYDILFVGIPANEDEAAIDWKKTYRTQFTLPEGSYILAISGCAG